MGSPSRARSFAATCGGKTGCRAMTLFELLVVIVILAGVVLFFRTAFVTAWKAYQSRLVRADLWQEANFFLEEMTETGRGMRQIDVSGGDDAMTVEMFRLDDDEPSVVYEINRSGELSVIKDGLPPVVLSEHIDFSNSLITKTGESVQLELTLADTSLDGRVEIGVSTDIYPRN